MSALLLSALGALLATLAQDAGPAFEPSIVKLEKRGGLELWTVRAHESSVRAVLARVIELSGRSLDATTAVDKAPLVTIELERRPLAQVLEFALGSAGLLATVDEGMIRVRAERTSEETPEQLADQASEAWARAASTHPEHPTAAMARLAQGELEELRGHGEAARRRYLDCVSVDPTSGAAGEAYLRAGRIAAGNGDWSEASEHYRALANLPGAEEYRALARVELARATMKLGDAEGALHILDALEDSHPCWERTERTARTLVRVEALLAENRCREACLELEARADQLDPLGAREVPRLRARALEGAGLQDEAAHAWLLVARDEQGPARIAAYRSAARLAEAASDPMTVLFVAREAEAAGFGASVVDAAQRARATLGVQDPATAVAPEVAPGAAARLAQAEELLEKHRLERATEELERLFDARTELAFEPLERARLAVAWTRCVAANHGIESATAVARSERPNVAAGEPRATLDRGVGHLLEGYGLYEQAAAAYQGDY